MKLQKSRLIGAGLLAVGIALCALAINNDSANSAQEAQKQPDTKKQELADFMRQKLGATNLIVEGLLVEDFDLISKGGKKLREMSSMERWRVSNDMAYRHHSEDFQGRVDKLLATSKDEAVDAAALAYFDTMMSCIDCHKWVRRVLIADNAPATNLKP